MYIFIQVKKIFKGYENLESYKENVNKGYL